MPAKTKTSSGSVERPDARQFKPVQSDSGNDIAVSRRDVVKNFKIHIDENEYSKPAFEEPSASSKPAKKDKSIYFAGRKPTKAQIERRHAQDKAREEKKKKDKQVSARPKLSERDQVARLSRIILWVAIFVCSTVIAAYGISCINDVLAITRSDELVTVDIEKGSDYNDVIKALDSNGLIKHRWFCKIITKFRGFDEEKYLYGKHYLTADMGVEGMLTAMLEDQTSDKTIRLSFPEGWTIPQIIEKLDENNVCPAEYIYDALKDVEFDYGFVRYIPTDELRCYKLEGYIFPDTYDFFVSEKENGVGENPTSILNKFLSNFETKWNDAYAKRAEELGVTLDEVIIIASIIEKEAADKSQMTKVSSVIHNRLNHPGSYPTLGCDSTKKYVTNYLTPVLGSAGANAYLGSYDTNSIRSGLPAGPICNPGVDAIEAALNPDDTNYYYFCHNEDGKIYMAETYAQFRANWAQVLRDNEGN
ncbi:MAG: endolytic transglycosylase MltG [Clostridia bacterium]|nr:endolytic transglycosylase MltG [Clostridia bacterium]